MKKFFLEKRRLKTKIEGSYKLPSSLFFYKCGVIIKVLGLDLATKKSGYCFKENKQLIDFGLIRANEKDDIDHRIMQIYLQAKDIVKKYKPDYIVFENTPSHNNAKLGRELSRLHGCIMSLVFDSNGKMGYRDYMPSKWRSAIGTYDGTRNGLRRDVQKQCAIDYINKKYNLDLVYDPKDKTGSDDIAEAICICDAFEIIEKLE